MLPACSQTYCIQRAVSSSSIMTTSSLPFSLSDAFLLHGHFLIYFACLTVPLEYKWISLVALFVSCFHIIQSFPHLGPDSVIHITHLLSCSPCNYASLGAELWSLDNEQSFVSCVCGQSGAGAVKIPRVESVSPPPPHKNPGTELLWRLHLHTGMHSDIPAFPLTIPTTEILPRPAVRSCVSNRKSLAVPGWSLTWADFPLAVTLHRVFASSSVNTALSFPAPIIRIAMRREF